MNSRLSFEKWNSVDALATIQCIIQLEKDIRRGAVVGILLNRMVIKFDVY